MWLVRTRFRRNTAAGRKAAARAARQAHIQAAAVVIQKNVRRLLAQKKVRSSAIACLACYAVHLSAFKPSLDLSSCAILLAVLGNCVCQHDWSRWCYCHFKL